MTEGIRFVASETVELPPTDQGPRGLARTVNAFPKLHSGIDWARIVGITLDGGCDGGVRLTATGDAEVFVTSATNHEGALERALELAVNNLKVAHSAQAAGELILPAYPLVEVPSRTVFGEAGVFERPTLKLSPNTP